MTVPRTPHLSDRTLTRRRFTQGAATASLASALTLAPSPLRNALAAPTPAPVLRGTEFTLAIEPVPLTINGRQAVATGVNGQVPAPILRWREGDSLTLAVTNPLARLEGRWNGSNTEFRWDGQGWVGTDYAVDQVGGHSSK
jgi:FtsP/CotA-like multicopper oxidase with cupredoxin domain